MKWDMYLVPNEHALVGVESAKMSGKPRNNLKPNEREALGMKNEKDLTEVVQDADGSHLLAIRRMRNFKSYLGKNCLSCHDVPENATRRVGQRDRHDYANPRRQSEALTGSIDIAMGHIAARHDSVTTVKGVLASASDSVLEVSRGLDTIAVATSEQRRVGAEVAGEIEMIAIMAQSNSAAASQTASAARNLETLAAEQQSTVGRFKT